MASPQPAPRHEPEAVPVGPRPARPRTWRLGWDVLAETFEGYSQDRIPRLSASLAYYTLFSLAPLLVIVIAIAGLVFGEQAARGEIVDQIRGLTGDQGAEAIQLILAKARTPSSGVAATILGLVTLLIGATGAFNELQDALNTVWGVMPKPGHTLLGILRVRFTSFVMVLGTGFLLLVSLVLSAALNALATFLRGRIAIQADVMEGFNVLLSMLAFTLLLMMIYKILPDVHIDWRDVWVGAALTSALFTVGKNLIGIYLGRSSVTSTYGAAGSIVIILLWIYYSATILYVGAEFTQVWARRFGRMIRPTKYAIRVSDVVHVQAKPVHAQNGEVKAAVKEEARRTVETAVKQVDRTKDVKDPGDPGAA